MNEETYWANEPDDKLAECVKTKMEEYDQYLESVGRIERLRKSWEFLNGLTDGAAGLRRGGKAGELVRISINNYRAFANNIHVLLTQAKSHFEVQAETMDFKAQAECIVGKSVVNYYNDEAKIGAKFSQSVLSALGNAEIFMELDWDESKGREFAVNLGRSRTERAGDITARMHHTLNVARDIYKKSPEENRWWIVRDWTDKWELAAEFPEHREHILSQKYSEDNHYKGRGSVYQKIRGAMPQGGGDQIEIMRLYHDMTPACPDGVDALICGGKVLRKKTIEECYGELPLKRFAAADIEGSFLAYSPLWDLIPLCEAADFLSTAGMTNAMNLAFTNIWSNDPNLKMEQLTTALGKITSATKPEALNLAQSSPEIGKQLEFIHQKSQFLTGINSVAAGQPEAVSNIKSGNGLALILSTAVQFQSVVQERYADFRSEVMSLLIKILQKKAELPMVIAITGKGKASYARTFKKDDIQKIRRVKCMVGSPIMATIGGRMQIADNIAAKYPQAVSVNAYIAVLETGNLDHIEGKSFNESMLLLSENEALSGGKEIPVNILEKHPVHIFEHLSMISTPEAKENPTLIKNATAHIMEHFRLWDQLTREFPHLLPIIGIPALAPMQNPAMPMPGQLQPGAGGSQPTPSGESREAIPTVEPKLPSMPSLPNAAPEGSSAAYAQVNQNPMGGVA